MPKGYIVVQWTGPRHAPGAYESWNEAVMKWFNEVARPTQKQLGAISWQNTSDWFGNTPRTMNRIEFDSIEQAVAAFVSPEFQKLKDQFLALGALDYEATVHRLLNEGKYI